MSSKSCSWIQLLISLLDYIVQPNRFGIVEGLGCHALVGGFGSSVLITNLLQVLFPLLSLILYSRTYLIMRSDFTIDIFLARLILTYLRRNGDLDRKLASNSVLDRHAFIKLLALGMFDIIITLPYTTLELVLDVVQGADGFWPGWKAAHEGFSEIPTLTMEEMKSGGFWLIFDFEFNQWINVLFAVAFFALFGLTEGKRAVYRGLFWAVVKPFGLKPHVDSEASAIVFETGPAVNHHTIDSTKVTTS